MEEDARDPRFREAWERTEKRATREIPAPWHDPREDGELPDAYIAMGQTAENVAELRGVTRQAQDEYAVRSQNRAETAKASGFFDRDITPVTLPDGTVISRDDSPRDGVTLEAVSALDPVFRPEGTVTAGNCCPLNDGAAALVLMEAEYAKELGITPLARVVATSVSGISPEIMGLGPVEATRTALARAGLSIRTSTWSSSAASPLGARRRGSRHRPRSSACTAGDARHLGYRRPLATTLLHGLQGARGPLRPGDPVRGG